MELSSQLYIQYTVPEVLYSYIFNIGDILKHFFQSCFICRPFRFTICQRIL